MTPSPIPILVMLESMPYPGGKGGDGVFRTVINRMPPHRVYRDPEAVKAVARRAAIAAAVEPVLGASRSIVPLPLSWRFCQLLLVLVIYTVTPPVALTVPLIWIEPELMI